MGTRELSHRTSTHIHARARVPNKKIGGIKLFIGDSGIFGATWGKGNMGFRIDDFSLWIILVGSHSRDSILIIAARRALASDTVSVHDWIAHVVSFA